MIRKLHHLSSEKGGKKPMIKIKEKCLCSSGAHRMLDRQMGFSFLYCGKEKHGKVFKV